jgi:hypothetical protein
MKKMVGIEGAILGAVLVGVYLRFIRPWQLRWGATDEEVTRSMPGDDIVKHPTFNATRAVTIQARPEEIWPWLVQIGCKRAGWYSYDWIDNLGIPSANRIVPELQHLEVGDLIPFSPDGKQGMWVKAFEPNQWMLWVAKEDQATWLWGLYPQDESHTRLITRNRVRYTWRLPWVLYYPLQDVGDIFMMRKCMLSIKRRAEQASVQAPEHAGATGHRQLRADEPGIQGTKAREQSHTVAHEAGEQP